MKSTKLIVAYPQPKDVEAFEAVYQNEHVPLALANLAGKTKMVSTKTVQTPQGMPAYRRSPFSLAVSAAAMRGVGRWNGNTRQCRENLVWGPASDHGR